MPKNDKWSVRDNKNNVVTSKTDAEKKQIKNNNKAKANPKLSEAKKEKNDACRDRRAARGSSKSFA